jgi:hypothetical protein
MKVKKCVYSPILHPDIDSCLVVMCRHELTAFWGLFTNIIYIM